MSISCSKCTAPYWLDERTAEHPSTKQNPLFNTCCNNGDVSIPLMKALLTLLHSLLYNQTSTSHHFRNHIRKYNSALAFVSPKYQASNLTSQGLQYFQIHGVLYHLTRPLEHSMNTRPQFAQIFLSDPDDAIEQLSIRPGGYVLPSVIDIVHLRQLLEILHEYNPFVTIYRTAYERKQQALSQLSQNNMQIILNPRMELLITKGLDQRLYNLPTTNEVAIIIPDEYREASHQDIIPAQ